MAGNIRKGNGCPACEHAPTSFAEQCLLGALRNWFGIENVISRDKSTIGKELDIYLPQYHTAVEIGSWYWHEKRLENDKEKRKECEKSGVRLIIIYDSFKEKKNPFDHDFYAFNRDLGSERGNTSLKELAFTLAVQMDDRISPIADEDWKRIIHEAYRQSRMSTPEEFRDAMKAINPNIEIVGEYTRARDRIKCHCLVCGNEWENTPYHLLKGQGCPNCSRISGAKRRVKAVRNIETGTVYYSAKDAAHEYGCSPEFLKMCCRGTYETCKGFHWEYCEQKE